MKATLAPLPRAKSAALKKALRAASGVEEIAFQVDDLRGLDGVVVEVGFGEFRSRAKVCIHSALAIRRDEDQAASGGAFAVAFAAMKRHADRPDVVGEDARKLIAAHLARKPRPPSKRGDAGAGVRRRAAGCFDGRSHFLIKGGGFLGRGQAHGALHKRELGEQRFLARGDDIDQRMADSEDLKSFGHGGAGFRFSWRGSCRFRSVVGSSVRTCTDPQ